MPKKKTTKEMKKPKVLKKNKVIFADELKKDPLPRRFYIKLISFTLILSFVLLFYPGNSYYVSLFAYNQKIFDKKELAQENNLITEIPVVKNPTVGPAITARGAYIIERNSATPLYEKNAHAQMLPASTTKMITALAAFDKLKLDDILTIKRVVDDGQVAGLVYGEKITFENLLYAMLVNSANDAAFAIADNYPGGYTVFMEDMNKKAQSLSMNESMFKNPAGFDEAGHYSSPFDLTLAARELLKNPELTKIVGTKDITVSDVNYQYFHKLYSINQLLGVIPGIAGLKTGYTEAAGENLVTLYKFKEHEYVITLLKSDDRFEDTKKIVSWIQTNIEFITITH